MNRTVNMVSGRLNLHGIGPFESTCTITQITKSVSQSDKGKCPVTELAKAAAGAKWCENASLHLLANGGKEWKYLLIPHNEVKERNVMESFVRRLAYTPK